MSLQNHNKHKKKHQDATKKKKINTRKKEKRQPKKPTYFSSIQFPTSYTLHLERTSLWVDTTYQMFWVTALFTVFSPEFIAKTEPQHL